MPGYRGLVSAPLLPVRTERLVLRTFTRDDVDDLLAYRGDPTVVRYLLFDVYARRDAEDFVARVAAHVAPVAPGDRLTLAIDRDGVVVGDLMLHLTGEAASLCEIGWVLNPAHGGQGLATEAARALIHLAFTRLGAHRVWAQMDARNEASARLCERLGMRREALMRRDFWNKGEWTDSLVYAVLAEEWHAT